MPTNGDLKRALTLETLRQLAGAKSFVRGEAYFADGQVTDLVEHAGKLSATVQGADEYLVTLFAAGDSLNFDCTCPLGADGSFCKHCVAAGLAWLAGAPESTRPKKGKTSATPVVTLEDARDWLAKQGKEALIEIILDQAAADAQLRDRLLLQAAKTRGKGANIAAIRDAMNRATRFRGFIDYRAARDFSLGISQVVGSIADLLTEGFAAEVIELAEYSLGKVEAAIMQTDDSAGYMGGILNELQAIHLAACQKAMPDPEALAERLFNGEMQAQFDTFHGAAETYAKLLGKRGLAAYHRCAEAAWAKVPQIQPGETNPEAHGKTYRIKSIMETLARHSGDIETLVAVKARDLSSAYKFLEIGTIYSEAKQYDRAIVWAERGIKAFAARPDHRLREFLAGEYHRQKRHSEAMQLIWDNFADNLQLETYKALKIHADRVSQWTAWREKAVAYIRDEIKRSQNGAVAARSNRWAWSGHLSDHSLLVQILLWEGDVESAWHEARTGGCYDQLWMELALKREKAFPADAAPIYQKQVEALINQKNHASYAEAVKLIRRIKGLMAGLGQTDEFGGYLAAIRATHKPKRNFIMLAAQL